MDELRAGKFSSAPSRPRHSRNSGSMTCGTPTRVCCWPPTRRHLRERPAWTPTRRRHCAT